MTINKKELQKEWAYNKYWVMAKSPAIYQHIRLLFKNNELTIEHVNQFYQYLEKARKLPLTTPYLIVAYQHIWGYFKKMASIEEKDHYLFLLDSVDDDPYALLNYLQKLTVRYQITYLLESKIIKEGL